MKLTLCMIVYNEEETIVGAINSVRHVINEAIIGIDDKTTDNTANVAKDFLIQSGIPHTQYPFSLDSGFASARNKGLCMVDEGYALILDGDETVDIQSAVNIDKIKRKWVGEEIESILVRQINHNEKGIVHQCMSPRILRGDVRYKYRWHEVPDIKTTQNASIPDIVILNKKTTKKRQQLKSDDSGDHIEFFKQDAKDFPDDTLPVYNLANCYLDMGTRNNDDVLVDKSLHLYMKLVNKPFLNSYMVDLRMVFCNRFLKRQGEAQALLAQMLSKYGKTRAEHLFFLGLYHIESREYIEALQYLFAASRTDVPPTQETVIVDYYTWLPMKYIYHVFQQLTNDDILQMQKAIKDFFSEHYKGRIGELYEIDFGNNII